MDTPENSNLRVDALYLVLLPSNRQVKRLLKLGAIPASDIQILCCCPTIRPAQPLSRRSRAPATHLHRALRERNYSALATETHQTIQGSNCTPTRTSYAPSKMFTPKIFLFFRTSPTSAEMPCNTSTFENVIYDLNNLGTFQNMHGAF